MKEEISKHRKPEYSKINDIFVERWSPRAMSGEEISEEDLMTFFEAGKWAPSSFNSQPWRFIYAKKNTEHWNTFYDLLVDFNKEWCKNASALVVIVSAKNFEYNNKPSRTHSFDTGSAWMNVSLQGSIMGLVIHGMAGFNYDKAKEVLKVPDNYKVEAMFAVGKPGKKEDLSRELQEKEEISTRKKLEEIVFEGKFKKNN